MTHGTTGAGIFPPDLVTRVEVLIAHCRTRRWQLATAESCTGGLVAALLTEVAGSSAVVDRGFVTYSNEAKADLLGVSWETLDTHGAVSRNTAEAMAQGAISRSRADASISITGIAGPGGGSDAKPVGLVHFALGLRAGPVRHVERRFGSIGRLQVRLASVEQALSMFEDACSSI